MIQAQDLRIGNWVSNGQIEFQITGKDIYHLDVYVNRVNVKPIPITPEWLERFGFEKDDTGVDMYDKDYFEWYQKEFPIIGMLCKSIDETYLFDENTETLRIYFIHQLQNLYFALTGEEITFKEQ